MRVAGTTQKRLNFSKSAMFSHRTLLGSPRRSGLEPLLRDRFCPAVGAFPNLAQRISSPSREPSSRYSTELESWFALQYRVKATQDFIPPGRQRSLPQM